MSIEALTVVLHHSKAKHSAKLVLLGIANHYHPDDERGAWPSQERLAGYANISDRAVRKCINELVELGELRVDSHGGPSNNNYKPNRYWITLECPDDCDRSMNHREKQPELFDRATGTIEQDNRNFLTEQPEPQFRLTVIEPKEEPKKNLNTDKKLFDEFWAVYPRKEAKAAARKQFDKAIKKVDFDRLLNGATRYKDDPNRTAQFTVQAARWLREERWDDDPLPARKVSWQEAKEQERLEAKRKLDEWLESQGD